MKSVLSTFVFAAVMTGGPLHGLQITLNYTTNGIANTIPAADPNGSRLMILANAAKAHWEDIIEDNHDITINIQYDNTIGANTIGQWNLSAESNLGPNG